MTFRSTEDLKLFMIVLSSTANLAWLPSAHQREESSRGVTGNIYTLIYTHIIYIYYYRGVCRRSIEASLALKGIFEEAILTDLFPQSMIDIYVQVLQSDGGKIIKVP